MKQQITSTELLDELTRTKIRVNEAQAEKLELKNSVMRKELVTMEEVDKQWADEVAYVRAKMLALPAKLAAHLADKNLSTHEIYTILDEAVKEALIELSKKYDKK